MRDVVGFQDSRKRTQKREGGEREARGGGETSPNRKTKCGNKDRCLLQIVKASKRKVWATPRFFVSGQGLYRLIKQIEKIRSKRKRRDKKG